MDGIGATSSACARYSVPGSQLLQLLALLRFWRIEAAQLLAGTGLVERELEEPEARIPLDVMNALVARARSLTGEPALGVFLGLRKRVTTYGLLGFATMSAGSLREALELSMRFSPTVSTALALHLHVEGELAASRIEERVDVGEVRDVALLALVIGLQEIGKALTGRSGTAEMHFAMARPAYCDRFPELFASARFDQPVTQLLFAAGALRLPLVAGDRAGLRAAQRECERALRNLGLDDAIVPQVRALIQHPDGMRSLQQIAEAMHMSGRTLKRRLAAQGTSFSILLEQARIERAQLLLGSTDLTLDEISERLGYSALPNFARAFRRWTGQTPASYRRARGTPAPV